MFIQPSRKQACWPLDRCNHHHRLFSDQSYKASRIVIYLRVQSRKYNKIESFVELFRRSKVVYRNVPQFVKTFGWSAAVRWKSCCEIIVYEGSRIEFICCRFFSFFQKNGPNPFYLRLFNMLQFKLKLEKV